jgi:phytoene dehydrogenase-like protein
MILPILGSGHNGLTAAFYLARAGRRPVVFERAEQVGGGAITTEIHPGFRCPTLTHEVLLHQDIVRDMNLTSHGLELLEGDVESCAPAPDGAPIVIYADAARTAEGLRAHDDDDARAWPAFRDAMARAASVLGPVLTAAPPDIDRPGAGDVLRMLAAGRRFRGLGKRDAYRLLRWLTMPAADFAGEWFRSERLKALVAGPGVSGTTFGPRSAGSTLVLLLREAHRQLAGGRTLRVRGGPGALTQAMAAAATAAGAEVRTGVRVERIVSRDGAVRGVVAGGREIPASTVVSALDPKTTFLQLIDPLALTPDFQWKMRNYRAAGTLAKVNLALSSLPSFVGVGSDRSALSGRIHLGVRLDDLERAFDHVKYGEWSTQPWLDVSIPSLIDPDLAPGGSHVASVYVHCAPPQLRSGTWESARPLLLDATLRVLERFAPGVSSLVLASEVLVPADLENRFGFAGGHVFHGELAIDQLFTMRPLIGYGRYGSPLQGLFLCGAGTHPGGFLTGASGRLAATEIVRRRSG